MTDVSIIIVNYNSKEYLDKCLGSVVKAKGNNRYELIVVDNASNDGSAELVRDKYPDVKLISNSDNLGFIKANNQGMRASSGKMVMCLNNDTIIKDDAIGKLVQFLMAHGDAGAVGPKLLNIDGTIQMQCRRGFPTPINSLYYFLGLSKLFTKSKRFGSYLLTYLDDKATVEVDSLCGAAMLVKREVLDKVGLMDESYFMYGDDIDWCYRIKKAGWKIFYLPEAEIVHYGGRGGSSKMSYRNIFEFYRSMAVFHKKHYHNIYIFIVNWLVYAAIWLKCGISLLQNLFRKEKYVGTRKP